MSTVREEIASRAEHRPVDRGMLVVAVVFLAGPVTTGIGFFGPHRLCLYTGLAVVLAGVLAGVVRLVGRTDVAGPTSGSRSSSSPQTHHPW